MTERMKEIVAEALNVEIETLKEDTSLKKIWGQIHLIFLNW